MAHVMTARRAAFARRRSVRITEVMMAEEWVAFFDEQEGDLYT